MSASNQDTHANFRATDGPTDHETFELLNRGKADHRKQVNGLRQQFDVVSSEVTRLTTQLLEAALRNDTDKRRADADDLSPAEIESAIAKKHWQTLVNILTAQFALFAGFFLLSVGAVVIPVVDAAVFYNLFKSGFQDMFGSLSSTDKWLAVLSSLQAVATILAFKLYAQTQRRRSILAVVAFSLGILFAVGAALEHAEATIAANAVYSAADIGFAWGQPEESVSAAPASTHSTISAYLLSLGFLILPIVGALMLSAGWESFKSGATELKTERGFRVDFRERQQKMATQTALSYGLQGMVEDEQRIVQAPLNDKIASDLKKVRANKQVAQDSRQSGMSKAVPPRSPYDPSVRYTDIDKVEAEADAALEKFGNGYCEDMYTRWATRRTAAP